MILSVTVNIKHIKDYLKQNHGYNICTVRRFCYRYLGYNKTSLENSLVYYTEAAFLKRRIVWKTEEDFDTLYSIIKDFIENRAYIYYQIRPFLERSKLRSSPEIKEKIINIIYNND